jgi:hypothetical protein
MIEVLLAACLSALLLIAILLIAIKNRLRQAVRSLDGMRDSASLKTMLSSVMATSRSEEWRQTSSLLALYRVVDGNEWLPTTREANLSPDLLLHIIRRIQREQPRVIVECGCGTSTIVMAHALANAGAKSRIHSIEEHPALAEETSRELGRRGLDQFATVTVAPLTERRYPGFETAFHWYDIKPALLPAQVDLILVSGPRTRLNECARYPAGPELLPRLAPNGYLYVTDADDSDQINLRRQWRALYPDLGIRALHTETEAFEMYFLDHKVRPFVQVGARSTDAA